MVSEGSAAGRGFAGMDEVRQLHVRFCKGIKIWHRAWFLCSLWGRVSGERSRLSVGALHALSARLEGWLALPSLHGTQFYLLKGWMQMLETYRRQGKSSHCPGSPLLFLMHGILGTVPLLTLLCSVIKDTIPLRHFTERIREVSLRVQRVSKMF